MSTNNAGTDARIHAPTVEDPVVRLVPLSPAMSGWWAAGPAVFENQTGLKAGDAGAWIGSVLSMTRAPEFEGPGGGWHGFWAVRGADVVGTCAYAAKADFRGRWEVAYFTFPPFESQGCGKAMVACLVAKLGQAHPGGVAMAKTSPAESASTRILSRLGFTRAEEASDPEHGPVWVWERPARDQ